MSRQLSCMALLATALCAAGARADDPADPAPPKLSFSGFGTLGVAHSSEKQADFTSTFFKPNGTGFTHSWGAGVDSLLAGQVLANPTSKLSAIVQVVAEQKYDDTYWPHVEWASLKYQFTPDFSVRVGRTLLPTFMVTDSRKIGYANPWVRPPPELYSLVPVTSNDGVDASYRLRVRSSTNTVQLTAGRSDSRFSQPGQEGFGTAEARALASFVYTFEQGPATVQLNLGRARISIPAFDPLFDAFRQFGPEGAALSDKYEVDDRLVTFLGIGASYDPGQWFVRGEWGRVNHRSMFGENTGWYASSGYRVGKRITPVITYARMKGNGNTSDPGLTVSALPPFLAGPATGLNAALNVLLDRKAVQQTFSICGRWDFWKNTALKLQLDHTLNGEASAGRLINLQPGFQRGGTVDVFSATIDFVF